MAVAATKFYCYSYDTATAKHNWAGDTFKFALTNTQPTAATDATLSNITQISGGGYPPGGVAAAFSSSPQANGQTTIVLADPPLFTASGTQMGPFRYAVLYNDSDPTDAVIAYWDYGSAKTLDVGESLQIDLDVSGIATFG